MIKNADRDAKNRYGVLAYLWSALQSLYQPDIAVYYLTLDGVDVEVEGVTCMISNSGHVGQGDARLSSTIRVDDGLLDVIIIQRANLQALLELLGAMAGERDPSPLATPAHDAPEHELDEELRNLLLHWQARKISVATALVVGFCRVYLGAHYPGYVVAGAISGMGLSIFYRRLLYRWMARFQRRRTQE